MTKRELILRHLQDIRRRSTKLWLGLPDDMLDWRPDTSAMTAIELIRHVLRADYGWNMIIQRKDMTNYTTPWDGRAHIRVQDELAFAAPYRSAFLDTIATFSEDELAGATVIHPGNGKPYVLGDYLLRIGYHESVHTGQFLSYLRDMGVERPFIWD